MQKKILAGIIAVLAVLVIVLGILSRSQAGKAKEGLIINVGGKDITVSWEEIDRTAFEGDLVNGKGETSHHQYEGAELGTILAKTGIELKENSRVAASSEDNYTAELSGAEILEAGKVYVALTRDGKAMEGIDGGQGAQLIVFGDKNSKRAVRYLKTIAIE